MIQETPGPGGPIPPGGVVGVLGGGQLGRMLALAAARLGLKTHIFAPPGDNPAFDVAADHTPAAWDDLDALTGFAEACDVVTLEFENVPVAALEAIAAAAPVRPGRRALETAQDRLVEKSFLREHGLETAPFFDITDAASLTAALQAAGGQGILKTRRDGYDGKGQWRLSRAEDAAPALAALEGRPAILEGLVAFEREISVIAARGPDGATAAYEPAENRHENGILRESRVPAAISPDLAARAEAAALRLAGALDYVGVLGVEFFALPDGALLVNEFAPRVHNSGHWTEDACSIGQFELQIRAVCGWPLPTPRRHADAVMTNLLGDEASGWPAEATAPGAALRLYGKAAARAGRKMGHVTQLSPRRE